MTVNVARTHDDASQRTAGGVAALHLAFALLAAIPYFLVVVDYPGATTAADKVDLIVDHYPEYVCRVPPHICALRDSCRRRRTHVGRASAT